MIVLIISLATILTFVTWMLIDRAIIRVPLGILSLLILAGSIWQLTDHFVNHTGMKITTKTSTKTIYTAGDTSATYGVLITKEIGTDSGNYVLVYRDKTTDTDSSAHFIPDTDNPVEASKVTTNYQLTDSKNATVTTVTKRYTWDSDLAEWLYGFAGEEGEVVSKTITAKVPEKTWLVLTDKQAEKLKTLIPQIQAKAKAQAAANPTATAALQALAKTNPELYAEQQIKMIKSALNIK
ncbi:DUF4811 domain-containing protein [Streptococcus saliviloxodontae]|uniref:DUF4811 domain-containing protein n=1 Tax=Streptococcus saliviloxodontae TaxID=1349416 RepID=A0ABS2PLJ8_9STRE|nr:DUF4811 domain-containing protein [Streptococcus saliviloxodontae]MBM7635668.1 hypothetical protein [Streptococcus saliviloxodontae]